MARSIEFMQGTGVEAADRKEASDIVDSLIEEEESNSSFRIVRVSVTPNDDGTYTVACNVRDEGYTENKPADAQKTQFENKIRGLHTAINSTLDAGAAERMVIRDE